MPDTKTFSDVQQSRTSGLLKILSVVATLTIICLFLLYLALTSNSFANKLIRHSLSISQLSNDYLCKIATITGNIYQGLSISDIQFKSVKTNSTINFNNIALSFSFATMGYGKKLEIAIQCDKITVNGFNKLNFLKKIPKIPANSCFLGLKTQVLLKSLVINKLVLNPFRSRLLNIQISDIRITSPSKQLRQQKSSLSFLGQLNNSKLFCGTFIGELTNYQSKLSGKLSAKILGQNIESQVALQFRKKSIKASGSFASATINIAKFSQWLIPLWQDNFPFGFDGFLSFKGTWAYNKKVGLLTNLQGSIKELRMVALGFYYPLFKINANWTLFNNSLVFKDSGSSASGFKCNFSGKIDGVYSKKRHWHLNFTCLNLDTKQYINKLPWGIKYSLSLPPINGIANFKFSIYGKEPTLTAEIKTKDMLFGKALEKKLTGHIRYYSSEPRSNFWQINYHWTAKQNTSSLFDRFLYKSESLSSIISKSNKFSMNANIFGKSLIDLSYKGELRIDKDIYKGSGKWFENGSNISFITPDHSKIFSATAVELFDFLFVK